jgi:meso-butanediol dehydrogenase / (S,S)-butanediol dehydrogenase / diacetyl reductase
LNHNKEEGLELEGATAIVTGGARGIGRGIAVCLAREGVDIAVADLPDLTVTAGETAEAVEAIGRRCLLLNVDVTDEAQTKDMVQQTVDQLGRVDILVNNAGVIKVAPVAAMERADWELIFDVNVKGTFLCSKAVLPHMMERRQGRIINLASIAGKTGGPGVSAYCASKFAVIGFTQSLAHEAGPFNITVNAICPGEVRTYMWDGVISPSVAAARGIAAEEVFDSFIRERVPLGRPQTPEDIGECAVYLCKADNVTGESINVAGGSELH